MTESLEESPNFTKDLFFWVRNFYGFILLGLILLGIYFFGYHEKCLGRAPLSYASQRTFPGGESKLVCPKLPSLYC